MKITSFSYVENYGTVHFEAASPEIFFEIVSRLMLQGATDKQPAPETSPASATYHVESVVKQVSSEIGMIDVRQDGNLVYAQFGLLTAAGPTEDEAIMNLLKMHETASKPPKVEKSVTPPRQPEAAPTTTQAPSPNTTGAAAPAVVETPPQQPAGSPVTNMAASAGEEPPTKLKMAGNFRQVIEYMLEHGFTEASEIEAECKRWTPKVPILSRLDASTLGDRIGRALIGMAEQVAAAKAKKSA